MKRYLQFILVIISFIIGLFFYALQSDFYLTTVYPIFGFLFWVLGLFILNDLRKKNFFYKISIFLKKILEWSNGRYDDVVFYLFYLVCMLLLVGCSFLLIELISSFM